MKNEEIPKWTERVLQGLAYWIGYRRQYYRHHDLTEGAIVAEACNLLNSCIADDQKLFCEVPYWHLQNETRSKGSGRDHSVDLVIAGADAKTNRELNGTEQVIIEVKRYSSGYNKIWEDIERMSEYLASRNNDVKCYLILVSEANKLSEKFLNSKFEASRKLQKSEVRKNKNNPANYLVRRVCKATSSFRAGAPEHAHYACLIEVVP